MPLKLDILIYVALIEEFKDVVDTFLGKDYTTEELKDYPLTLYRGEINTAQDVLMTVALISPGQMGNTLSAAVTSAVISQLNPLNIIVYGIAGSLSDDLNPGDVFIPKRIDEYSQNGAVVGKKKNSYLTSGNFFDTDRRLLDRFRNFYIDSREGGYQQWKTEAQSFLNEGLSGEQIEKLKALNISLDNVSMLIGDDRNLASGPAVAKGAAFVAWLKDFDRKVAAVEMESAGVYEASYLKIKRPRTIAIRPISDVADERKAEMEKIVKKSIRSVGVKNGILLVKRAIIYGVFNPDEKKKPVKNS